MISRIKAIVLILLSLGVSSCSLTIARLAGLYKTPRIESKESVKDYCEQQEGEYNALYTVANSGCLDSLVEYFGRLPSVLVFDSRKRLVFREDLESCTWKSFSEIESENFNTANKLPKEERLFEKILACSVLIDDREMLDEATHHLFITWAKFLPKQTEEGFSFLRSIRENSTNAYRMHSLNFDQVWRDE